MTRYVCEAFGTDKTEQELKQKRKAHTFEAQCKRATLVEVSHSEFMSF